MPKKPYISDEEKNQFRDAVKNVRPLNQDKYHHPKTIDKQQANRHYSGDGSLSYSNFSLNELDQLPNDKWVGGEDKLHFARPSLQQELIQKMRKGKINIESRLDLHHMNVTETLIAVDRFIQNCKNQNIIWACIVHGKGRGSSKNKPILKNLLNQWLRKNPYVLAFHTAQPKDGGAGAIYILLGQRKR